MKTFKSLDSIHIQTFVYIHILVKQLHKNNIFFLIAITINFCIDLEINHTPVSAVFSLPWLAVLTFSFCQSFSLLLQNLRMDWCHLCLMAGPLHLSFNKTATIIFRAFIAHVFYGNSNPRFNFTVTEHLWWQNEFQCASKGHHVL